METVSPSGLRTLPNESVSSNRSKSKTYVCEDSKPGAKVAVSVWQPNAPGISASEPKPIVPGVGLVHVVGVALAADATAHSRHARATRQPTLRRMMPPCKILSGLQSFSTLTCSPNHHPDNSQTFELCIVP